MLKPHHVALGLAILVAMLGDSWGQSQPSLSARKGIEPSHVQTAEPNKTPVGDQRGTDQSPISVKILPTAESAERAAAEARREDQKTANDDRIARFTERLFWATVALSVIAVFQFLAFLWQGAQLQRTVRATEKEFLASHRPRMRLKHMWLIDQTAWRMGGPFEVNLDIVNVGDTTGGITWINYDTLILAPNLRLPQRPTYDEFTGEPGLRTTRFRTNTPLRSGVTLARPVCDGRILDDTEVHDILWGERRLYLIGTIEYVDSTGVRQTGFCRQFTYNSYPPDPQDFGRFEIYNDYDYEFED
jgi:hypothetical protein